MAAGSLVVVARPFVFVLWDLFLHFLAVLAYWQLDEKKLQANVY